VGCYIFFYIFLPKYLTLSGGLSIRVFLIVNILEWGCKIVGKILGLTYSCKLNSIDV